MKNNKLSYINIDFNLKLSKIERKFINYLIDTVSNERESSYKLKNLENKFSIKLEKLIKILDKLQQNSIFIKEEEKIIKLSFINYYELDNYFVKIYLGDKLKEFIIRKDFDINLCFLFNDVHSRNFYYDFCYKTESVKELKFLLTEFKEYFDLDSYERFYDFERFFIKKVFEEINKHSNYYITYEKIKSGQSSNHKIIGINITIKNKLFNKYNLKIIELLYEYRCYNNKEKAFDIIYEFIKHNKIELAKEVLELVYKNGLIIENSFEEQANIILNKNTRFKLIKSYSLFFPNIIKLQNFLFEEIKKIDGVEDIYDEFTLNSFLKRLYCLKDGENFDFEAKNIILNIIYHKAKNTEINIYKVNLL